MVIDSHTHLWPKSVGRDRAHPIDAADELIDTLDAAGVDAALVVCTEKPENPANNCDVLAAAARHPGRLVPFPDIDSFWGRNYRQPGGAARLVNLINATGARGVTHYPDYRDYDRAYWDSEDGLAFFGCANELGLAISMPVYPFEHRPLQRLAERFPNITFLCHHLGGVRRLTGAPAGHLELILDSARRPNIWIKVSGFHYLDCTAPFRDAAHMVRPIFDAFGARRLVWGSDYPVSLQSMNYILNLHLIEAEFAFISASDRIDILGGNLRRLLSLEPPY